MSKSKNNKSKKTTNNETEITYSLITLGNSGVGKTSVLKRLAHDKFEENMLSTIGFGLSTKMVTLKNGKQLNLKLIDTAGQEQYRALGKTYFKNSDCVLFVFSLNDKQSFEDIQTWLQTFNDANAEYDFNKLYPAILIGNKSDLEHVVNEEEIKKFTKENKFYAYKEISCKDKIGFELFFDDIAEMLNKVYGKKKNKQNIKLTAKHKEKSKSCKCIQSDGI